MVCPSCTRWLSTPGPFVAVLLTALEEVALQLGILQLTKRLPCPRRESTPPVDTTAR